MTSAGRRAERVGDEPHLRVAQRHLDLRERRRLRPAEQAHALVLLRREVGHAGLGEDLVGELHVLLRHHVAQHLPELLRVELVHPLVLAGDDDVDAVGLVADVLVDPLQLHLELLGREADGAEHAEAARLGDGGHDVAAVGEGEDRELDAELVAEGGVHGDQSFERGADGVKRTGIVLTPFTKSEWSRLGGAGQLEVGKALDDLAHGRLDLGAGEAGAEAEVLTAAAEGDVLVRGARHVEDVRVLEHLLVAVGGGVVHDDLVALLDRHAADLGVAGGGAPEVVDRRAPAEHLLHAGVPERRVLAEPLRLVGVVDAGPASSG